MLQPCLMQAAGGQAQLLGDTVPTLVACPQQAILRQAHGGEQGGGDIADAKPEQPMKADETRHFLTGGDAGLRQILQGAENKITLPQVSQGKFARNEGMDEHRSGSEQRHERLVGCARMVDPHGGTDQVMLVVGAAAGRSPDPVRCPPNRASRRPLSRSINALSPRARGRIFPAVR